MHIQLVFSNPLYVSTSEIKCQILINFGDGLLFKSAGYNLNLLENTIIKKYLNRQLTNTVDTSLTLTITKFMKEVLEFLTAFGPVFNFLFGFTSSKIWEMIEGIQLIAMYPML